MDRIAIISDIHGNIPALEAVLEDIRLRGADEIFCLGDLVGKGPDSGEAVDLVRSACAQVVAGNWDLFIAGESAHSMIKWHQALLGEDRLQYLAGLPFCMEFRMSGQLVRLFHASPRSVNERILPWDDMEKRLSLFDPSPLCREQETAAVAGYGDIHSAYLQNLDGKILFNTGSVGNPLDMPQASYAILDGTLDSSRLSSMSIQLVKVPYNLERAVQLAIKADMPGLDPYIRELRTAVYRGSKKLD